MHNRHKHQRSSLPPKIEFPVICLHAHTVSLSKCEILIGSSISIAMGCVDIQSKHYTNINILFLVHYIFSMWEILPVSQNHDVRHSSSLLFLLGTLAYLFSTTYLVITPNVQHIGICS